MFANIQNVSFRQTRLINASAFLPESANPRVEFIMACERRDDHLNVDDTKASLVALKLAGYLAGRAIPGSLANLDADTKKPAAKVEGFDASVKKGKGKKEGSSAPAHQPEKEVQIDIVTYSFDLTKGLALKGASHVPFITVGMVVTIKFRGTVVATGSLVFVDEETFEVVCGAYATAKQNGFKFEENGSVNLKGTGVLPLAQYAQAVMARTAGVEDANPAAGSDKASATVIASGDAYLRLNQWRDIAMLFSDPRQGSMTDIVKQAFRSLQTSKVIDFI